MSVTDDENPLVVAQLIGSFSGGGAQRVAYDLVCGMAGPGVRSLGIAIRGLGDGLEFDIPGTEFCTLSESGRSFASLARISFRLRNLFVQERVRVVHVHGTGSLPLAILAARLCLNRPRVCFTWHDSGEVLEHGRFRTAVLAWCVRRCDWITASSRNVAARLASNAGVTKVDVLHGGVALKPLSVSGLSQPVQIAWIASLTANKDPILLLRAIAKLRDEGFSIAAVFAGGPFAQSASYEREVLDARERLGLTQIAKFTGQVSRAEVDQLLAGSLIGVQTSRSEGLSLALLEQMMHGLAVVATDVGDTRDAILHEQTGLLYQPGDEAGLTDHLRRLLLDGAMRGRLGVAARARAMSDFSVDSTSEKALAHYQHFSVKQG